MLTQSELSSKSGPKIFEDDNMTLMSSLDGFAKNPMEQDELEYFKSQFESNSISAEDTLKDFVQSQQDVLEKLSTSSTPSVDPPPYHLSFYESSNSSESNDATSLIYDSDELKPFAMDFSSFNGLITLGSVDTTPGVDIDSILESKPITTATFDLEGGIKYEYDIKYKVDTSNMYTPPSSDAGSPTRNNPFDCSSSDIPAALRLKPEEYDILAIIRAPPGATYKDSSPGCPGGNGKGKISVLQKRALDTVFSIIEQPSRGLVLNIAQELGLHHITVKNFFSNGRRRLRRAAARILDPERTQKENQKRKEKRRLAALTASVNKQESSHKVEKCVVTTTSEVKSTVPTPSQNNIMETETQREPSQISPQRRALMEKLANKVQRNVAQRCLQGDIPDLGQICQNTNTAPIDFTSNLELNHLNQLSSATIDALAGSQLDFDINALEATHLDATHLDLQAYLELNPPSSLDLQDPLSPTISPTSSPTMTAPVTGVDTPPVSEADISMSDIDFTAISDLDLIQNTTTELLEVPQDPDPFAFF